jgi:hypothetical protein
MSIAVMIVILIIAIVPVAMVLRSKRRRLGTRASGDAAAADPQSTLRIGDSPSAGNGGEKWAPSAALPGKRPDPRGVTRGERKPLSKDATAASDAKSTLKLS